MLDVSKIDDNNPTVQSEQTDSLLNEVKTANKRFETESAKISQELDMLDGEIRAYDMEGRMKKISEESELEAVEYLGDSARDLQEEEMEDDTVIK